MVHVCPGAGPRVSMGMSIYVFSELLHRELAINLCLGVINMSVKWRKRLHYSQITPFLVFLSFAWERDIWPIND